MNLNAKIKELCSHPSMSFHQVALLEGLLEEFSEARSRKDFELMAAVKYPGALALGRHLIHRTYKNANLEKRWKGWLLCDQYRHGINHEEEV